MGTSTRGSERSARADGAGRIARLVVASFVAVLALGLGLVYPWLGRGADWWSATWQHPWAFFGLVLIPLVFWRVTLGVDRRSAHLRLGTVRPFAGGPVGWRARFRDVPGPLRSVGLVFCLAALARPVSTVRPAMAEEEGIDLVVALDLSGSMEAVMDNLPPELEKYLGERQRSALPARVDAAKAVLRDFIGRRRSDRIGIVVFAKDAFVLSPPTLDYQLLDSLVSRMQLNVIEPHGTAIGDALGVAAARLRRSDASSKAVILLTDGDNQGGRLSPEYGAHLSKSVGARVYTVQIGEGDAARVFKGFDLLGQPRYESRAYPTNPELLKKLAEDTGGSSYVASDATELRNSLHDVLDELEKTRFEAAQATYEDLYRFLLLPGVVLIALEALLGAFVLRRFP
jgi:Ca-activated chloride channel family protein